LFLARLFGRVRLPARTELARTLVWTLPLLLSLVYLLWFNDHFDLASDLLRGGRHLDDPQARGFLSIALEKGGERALPILHHFAQRLSALDMSSPLLLFLALVLLAPAAAFGRARLTLTLWLLLALCGYMAIYLGTFWQLEEHLATSAHRLVYHLVP